MQDPLAFQNIEKECSPEANCINDFEILLVVERNLEYYHYLLHVFDRSLIFFIGRILYIIHTSYVCILKNAVFFILGYFHFQQLFHFEMLYARRIYYSHNLYC
jgi:hypothetical protein